MAGSIAQGGTPAEPIAARATRAAMLQRHRGPWRDAGRRLLSNRMAVVGGAIVIIFVFLALFGQYLAPQNALKQDLANVAAPPSGAHWFGTDELGRDFFSRILAGARTALIVSVLVTFISAAIGTVVGLISAYARGWVDSIFMRVADLLLAFPAFLLAAFLNATLRPPIKRLLTSLAGMTGFGVLGGKEFIDFIVVFGALAVISWSGYARLIRSQVLSLREREFVEAARAIGAPTRTILFRHILPNSIAPIIVAISVNFGSAILAESALSYLGVGIQPPTPSWGQMINANLDQMRYYPHLILIPGSVLALLILGFNFFGDGVADALDPRRSRR
jgi:peptide/nickel transport system permease protein